MPKTIQKRPISWDKLVQMALDIGDRYRVYKHKRSPFIHIIDRFNNNKKVSLKGLYVDVLEDRLLALKIVEHLGEETFPSINVVTLIERIRNDEAIDIAEHNTFDWKSLKECTENHVIKTMKGSSGKNVRATLNRIYEDKLEFKWEAILKWLKKKHTVDQRGFLNNLDSLEQIRLAYLGQKGVEPEWLTRELLLEQRSLHNQSKKKLNRYQNNTDMVDIRGIPTKKEAEKLASDYDLDLKILNKQECEDQGMGAYLAVAKGSDLDPNFIHLKYSPKNVKTKAPHRQDQQNNQNTQKSTKIVEKRAPWPPKGSKKTPKGTPGAPRSTQMAPKGPPRRPKGLPRPPQRRP